MIATMKSVAQLDQLNLEADTKQQVADIVQKLFNQHACLHKCTSRSSHNWSATPLPVQAAGSLAPDPCPAGSVARLPSSLAMLVAWLWRTFLDVHSVVPAPARDASPVDTCSASIPAKSSICASPLHPLFVIGPNLLSSNRKPGVVAYWWAACSASYVLLLPSRFKKLWYYGSMSINFLNKDILRNWDRLVLYLFLPNAMRLRVGCYAKKISIICCSNFFM